MATFYGSDDELLAVAVPFVQQGVEAGEPTLLSLSEATTALVRERIGDSRGVTFLDHRGRHDKPAAVLHAAIERFSRHVADGARQIRTVSETPHDGHGARWDWWARYEATLNHAFAGFPLWNLCSYDVRIASGDVVADVLRTHPSLATADSEHQVNPRYLDPVQFLAQRGPGDPDALEATPPLVDELDPTPARARAVTRDVARVTLLERSETDDMVMAVSEAVTNAGAHGRPPVRLRVWAAADRIVATVDDRGEGPADPFIGLLPTTDTRTGGMGLWLAHQMCGHVRMDRTPRGFTVALVSETARMSPGPS